MPVLSVLIPAFNEESTIGTVLDKLAELSRDSSLVCGIPIEIVIVNDGSSDKTETKIEEFIKDNPDVLVRYQYQDNGGKGTAIRTALGLATGDILVVQDADLEYDPRDFAMMLPFILSGEYSVVFGSRFLNHKNKHSYQSFYLGGQLVSITANILYHLHLTDEPTCYKMFKREVLTKINLRCTGFEFCPEFTAKVSKSGYSIIEVPIHYYPRSIADGKKISWKDGVEAIWTLLKYKFVR